jgi:hypothetical protein
VKIDHLGFNSEEQKTSLNERIITEYEEKLESFQKQLQEDKEKSGCTILLKAVNQV